MIKQQHHGARALIRLDRAQPSLNLVAGEAGGGLMGQQEMGMNVLTSRAISIKRNSLCWWRWAQTCRQRLAVPRRRASARLGTKHCWSPAGCAALPATPRYRLALPSIVPPIITFSEPRPRRSPAGLNVRRCRAARATRLPGEARPRPAPSYPWAHDSPKSHSAWSCCRCRRGRSGRGLPGRDVEIETVDGAALPKLRVMSRSASARRPRSARDAASAAGAPRWPRCSQADGGCGSPATPRCRRDDQHDGQQQRRVKKGRPCRQRELRSPTG